MFYVLIGETRADAGPLFVLWTRDASGVQVLPVGSHDRRDMQIIGRRIMQAWTVGGGTGGTTETIRAALQGPAEGRTHRLVELVDFQRDAIARSLELRERDEPTLPAA